MHLSLWIRRHLLVGLAIVVLANSSTASASQTRIFESASFDVSFAWDPEIWHVRQESSDKIVIAVMDTAINVQVLPDKAMDVDACRESSERKMSNTDGIFTIDRQPDVVLPDAMAPNDPWTVSYVIEPVGLDYAAGFIQVVTCHEIEGDGLLFILIEARTGIYDEELEIINTVLNSLVVDGQPLASIEG